MNNDLISRSALKNDLKQFFTVGVLDGVSAKLAFNQILHDIDNAPAVEVGYLTNCANCEKVEKIRAKRPQGEWIRSSNMSKRSYQRVCNNCHKIVYFCGKGNYPNCPYCLADMRGANNG